MESTVNPVIVRESNDDVRAKSSCRIHTCASIIDTNHLIHNDCETDSNRSEKRGFLLFNGKHQDNKDQLCRQKHFEKQTYSINFGFTVVLPCAILTPPPNLVAQFKGPGMSSAVMAAAQIPPSNCATNVKKPLRGVMAPTMTNANETAGLNIEPETRKKIQTLMITPMPDDTDLNNILEVSMSFSPD